MVKVKRLEGQINKNLH